MASEILSALSDFSAGLFDLLTQVTGTGGGDQHAAVYFVIAALLWATLLTIARSRSLAQPHHALLALGFAVGLGRELFMLGIKIVTESGIISFETAHTIFPPLEHALGLTSMAIVSGAYIFYFVRQEAPARRMIRAGIFLAWGVYSVTFFWWGSYLLDNPDVKFGQTWCDWLFHIVSSSYLALVVVILHQNGTGRLRRWVCVGLGFFFVAEFLKLPDVAMDEAYEHLFAPIRHTFYLGGIWLLGYVYIREHASELQEAFDALENRVSERTHALQEALANLSVANDRLTVLSTEDPLTGLKNRRFFDAQLQAEWERARRSRNPLSLVLIDVDHFKRVNDQWGHEFGDLCLAQISNELRSAAQRATDTVARYGGEEFAMILPDTEQIGAVTLANGVREAVARLSLREDDSSVRLTISAGVATAIPGRDDSETLLFRKADKALYAAKNAGRNCVKTAEDSKPDSPAS